MVAILLVTAGVVATAAPEALARLDALHARRHEAAALSELRERLEGALAGSPEDYELLWRAARLAHWEADGEGEPERKRERAQEAWRLGERAAAREPGRPEGHFWAAAGLGTYAQAVGVLKALRQGLERQFNTHLEAALRLDPDLDRGGPLVARGRYYYELPWPKRRLGRSREWLERALERHPENLRAHLYLAETLLADGEARRAAAALERVEQGSSEYDPAEAARAKERARPLRARIEEELR